MSNFLVSNADVPSRYSIVAYDNDTHEYTYCLLSSSETVGWFDTIEEAENVAWSIYNNKGRAF